MARERVKRLKPTYPDIDLRKPVDLKAIKPKDDEDCFSREWMPDHKFCVVCADNEMCGIRYNALQNKKVKKLEQEKGGYLDNMHFDSIDLESVEDWLAKKPRTTQQFIDKITEVSNCSDETTAAYWCKSFIVERKRFGIKNGMVIVKA